MLVTPREWHTVAYPWQTRLLCSPTGTVADMADVADFSALPLTCMRAGIYARYRTYAMYAMYATGADFGAISVPLVCHGGPR